jgi:cell wall-associated NlpC family hydrolase
LITQDELIVQARALVGVPWKHQGRSGYGVDCIGLIDLSFKGAGIDWAKLIGVVDQRDYGRSAQPELLRLVREHCEIVSLPIDGCLIVMKFPQERYPRHFGIYAHGNIIHADARAGNVVEHGYRGLWQRCQHSLWKIPGVSYA